MISNPDQAPLTLIQTKLYRPPIGSGYIVRQRLLDQLNSGLDRKLILVSAPAGYGKTSLVASWLANLAENRENQNPNLDMSNSISEEVMPRYCWLALEPGDNDPARFFGYLAAAFNQIDTRIGRTIEDKLENSQGLDADSLIGDLINEITADDNPFILVLDDYHHINSQFIHQSLTFLLEHQPIQMSLVIVTREDPPIALARLRGIGQVIEIRQGDLRFTESETSAFLIGKLGLPLKPEDISALDARTEGWIVGLQLAAISMQGRVNIHNFVKSFTGSNRFILDYLIEEVFERQPADIQDFLLQTSILARLQSSLCSAVTGRMDCQKVLEALEQANLFVVPLDDTRQWYRYHHLFSDLLLHKLQKREQEIRELHLRACQWYREHGLLSDAVNHALAANAATLAATLMEEASEGLLKSGQIATLLAWLEFLPSDEIQAKPELCLTTSWALALSGRLDTAEKYLQLVEPILSHSKTLYANYLVLQTHIARARHDIPKTIDLGYQALSTLPANDGNSRSVVGVNLGAAHLYKGELEKALDIWSMTEEMSLPVGNYHAGALALSFMGQIWAARGHIRRAAGLYRRAISIGREKNAQPVAARAHVNLGLLWYEWNDLERAHDEVKRALTLSQAVKDVHVQRDALRIMAMVQQAQGYGGAATKSIQQADELLKGKHQPANAFQVNALTHLQLALMAGDLDLASRWQDRIEELNPERKPIQIGLIANAGCLIAIPDILKNQLLIIKGQKEMAAHYLAELNQIALEQQLGYCRLAILVLQALASPDPVSASSFLNMALSLGQEEDHMRLFIDHGSSLLRLLRSSNIEDANISYKNKLISSFPPPTQLLGPEMPRQIDTAQPLTDRELEILQLLAKHQTNAEISQSLVISANTVKTHLQHIYEKLNVHNRRAAVIQARKLGLL